MRKLLILAGLIVIFVTGCASSDQKDPYLGQTAPMIYAKAHHNLQKRYFNDAITAYQSLTTQYPFGHYAKKGDLDIIYAYFISPILPKIECCMFYI